MTSCGYDPGKGNRKLQRGQERCACPEATPFSAPQPRVSGGSYVISDLLLYVKSQRGRDLSNMGVWKDNGNPDVERSLADAEKLADPTRIRRAPEGPPRPSGGHCSGVRPTETARFTAATQHRCTQRTPRHVRVSR